MGGKTYWEGGLGTTEQNFPIFFGAAVADIPTSFSKIETVPKMTHMSGHSENKPSETF